MNTFLITGLPRSRTAWLAEFFTTGDTHCFHELMAHPDFGKKSIKEVFEAVGKGNVGICGSDIPFYVEEVLKEYPETKHSVICRATVPVVDSLNKLFGADMGFVVQLLIERLNLYMRTYAPFMLNFEELNDEEMVERLWNHCTAAPFDSARYHEMKDVNIQITDERKDALRRMLWHG